MKLLLTSTGLMHVKIANAFIPLFSKKMSDVTLLFITTASQNEEENKYIEESRQELLQIGIKKENIYSFAKLNSITEEKLAKIDCIYVCGGNTFYLLDHIKKTGFEKKIKKWGKRKTPEPVYVGVSAGSIIAGPNITIAGLGEEGDKNEVYLKDLCGFSFVDFALLPHYTQAQKKVFEKFSKTAAYKTIAVTNTQAILVEKNRKRVIE